PAAPTGSAVSNVAQWVTPVAGETAQPVPWLVRSPLIAAAGEKPFWLKLAWGFWSFKGLACLGSALGAAVTSIWVKTKLPSGARAAPLLGGFSWGFAWGGVRLCGVRAVRATTPSSPWRFGPLATIVPSGPASSFARLAAFNSFGWSGTQRTAVDCCFSHSAT